MFQKGTGRVLALFVGALIVEQVTRNLPDVLKFSMVFIVVFAVDNLKRISVGSARPLFLEDVVLGVLMYASFGCFSFALDSMLSIYTGRHASPIFPALMLALTDKAWPSQSLSSKRR